MKERPILMCGEMVRAGRNGTKTQTRRVVNPKLWPLVEASEKHNGHVALDMVDFELISPYGSKKDRLWVKETFRVCAKCQALNFAATVNRPKNCAGCDECLGNWKPSIFMPRKLSRITLEITGLKVERVQEISMEDAIAEGIKQTEAQKTVEVFGSSLKVGPYWKFYGKELERLKQVTSNPIWSYQTLWDTINGKKFPWKSNPWVWVVEFKVVAPKEGK